MLDGELCVFDEDLVSQFHLLGRPDPAIVATPPVLMAFDCLRVLGVDVRGLPLHRRRAMLEEELASGPSGLFPARRLADHGHAAWAIVKERRYEGLVGEDQESAHRGGTSRDWPEAFMLPIPRSPWGLRASSPAIVYGWAYLMAGAVLTTLPVIAAYIYIQKYMVEGLTAGNGKG